MKSLVPTLLAVLLVATLPIHAGTLISVDTPVGSMTLELDDADKPVTVANFLNYLNSGRYENLFAHRLDDNFVLQSGGFTLSGNSIAPITEYAPIVNEFTADPRFSNLYGTIAMAKVDGDPDSATSGWYINLGNNTHLDSINGGFTVFGRVIAGFDTLEKFNTDFPNQPSEGQGVYDKRSQLGSPFGELPLLENSLVAQNLLYTDLTVVPPAIEPSPSPSPAPSTSIPALTVDTTRPSIRVKGRRSVNSRRNRVVFRGTAADTGGLSGIEFKISGQKGFRRAKGTTRWKAIVRPNKSRLKTVVKVRAVDTAGNKSRFLKLKTFRR